MRNPDVPFSGIVCLGHLPPFFRSLQDASREYSHEYLPYLHGFPYLQGILILNLGGPTGFRRVLVRVHTLGVIFFFGGKILFFICTFFIIFLLC